MLRHTHTHSSLLTLHSSLLTPCGTGLNVEGGATRIDTSTDTGHHDSKRMRNGCPSWNPSLASPLFGVVQPTPRRVPPLRRNQQRLPPSRLPCVGPGTVGSQAAVVVKVMGQQPHRTKRRALVQGLESWSCHPCLLLRIMPSLHNRCSTPVVVAASSNDGWCRRRRSMGWCGFRRHPSYRSGLCLLGLASRYVTCRVFGLWWRTSRLSSTRHLAWEVVVFAHVCSVTSVVRRPLTCVP